MKQRDMSQPNFTKPERKAYPFRVLPTGALILRSGAMYARDERGCLRKIVVNKGERA